MVVEGSPLLAVKTRESLPTALLLHSTTMMDYYMDVGEEYIENRRSYREKKKRLVVFIRSFYLWHVPQVCVIPVRINSNTS